MKVLFLTKYADQGASTRYRVLQYLPELAQSGIEATCSPLFCNSYLSDLYETGQRSVTIVAASYYRRAAAIYGRSLTQYDTVFVQAECFPYLPFVCEHRLFSAVRKVILDYDDAVFETYRGKPFLSEKIAALTRLAWKVVVGSESLAAYARRHNSNVVVLPTVVDTRHYIPRSTYELIEPRFVVGWIGTPITATFLRALARPLQALSSRYSLVLRCIGTRPGFSLPGVEVENVPWDSDTEGSIIRTFDAGIMPLSTDAFSQGKCGLKLIQYMAAGVPSIGMAIGANQEIIQHGSNGLLAADEFAFQECLDRLMQQSDLRSRLGRAGRSTVEIRYSLQAQATQFVDLFEDGAHRQTAQTGGCLIARS